MRLRKEFTKADEDDFPNDAFEFLDRFFQGSLKELEARNSGIQGRHRRIDGNCLTAAIYQYGLLRSHLGTSMPSGGGYSIKAVCYPKSHCSGSRLQRIYTIRPSSQMP
ncbi:hypothetical protein [Leisingera aquimarina]|uniref:hypothetical protein n=1 Tax=Leisingera aquimarina TaxID=476529 RepID=UPI0012EBE26F|nr:hypothetical protein [Leisingera aquimarina]